LCPNEHTPFHDLRLLTAASPDPEEAHYRDTEEASAEVRWRFAKPEAGVEEELVG
jgi:hypothetical protein